MFKKLVKINLNEEKNNCFKWGKFVCTIFGNGQKGITNSYLSVLIGVQWSFLIAISIHSFIYMFCFHLLSSSLPNPSISLISHHTYIPTMANGEQWRTFIVIVDGWLLALGNKSDHQFKFVTNCKWKSTATIIIIIIITTRKQERNIYKNKEWQTRPNWE